MSWGDANTCCFLLLYDTLCCSVVECLLMVSWDVGSIPAGGTIELFLVPTSASQLVYYLSV